MDDSEPTPDPLPWHRLLGLAWTGFYAGSTWTVEIERDLSVQQQRLDLLILRRGDGPEATPRPAGLDGSARHFLLTFKSIRQPLDAWAVQELVGHYVAYRKLVSPHPRRLLDETAFRLVAGTMRFPSGLNQQHPLRQVDAGVYDFNTPLLPVRVVVTRELPAVSENAVWNLFSSEPGVVLQARDRFRTRLAPMSAVLDRLFAYYQLEGLTMPYTMDDFLREETERVLQRLTPEERLAGLAPEQRLAGLAPEQRLAGLAPEQRLAGLAPEQLRALRELLDKSQAEE